MVVAMMRLTIILRKICLWLLSNTSMERWRGKIAGVTSFAGLVEGKEITAWYPRIFYTLFGGTADSKVACFCSSFVTLFVCSFVRPLALLFPFLPLWLHCIRLGMGEHQLIEDAHDDASPSTSQNTTKRRGIPLQGGLVPSSISILSEPQTTANESKGYETSRAILLVSSESNEGTVQYHLYRMQTIPENIRRSRDRSVVVGRLGSSGSIHPRSMARSCDPSNSLVSSGGTCGIFVASASFQYDLYTFQKEGEEEEEEKKEKEEATKCGEFPVYRSRIIDYFACALPSCAARSNSNPCLLFSLCI